MRVQRFSASAEAEYAELGRLSGHITQVELFERLIALTDIVQGQWKAMHRIVLFR